MRFFVVLLVLILDQSNSSKFQAGPLKSEIISPSEPSKNGVTVTTRSSNDASKWILNPIDEIGYDMKITFDSRWGWIDDDSIINITLNNDAAITNADDLIIVFSVNDTKYFSSIISINNAHDNLFYPKCPGNSGINLVDGDIKSILTDISNAAETRISKVSKGGNITSIDTMKDIKTYKSGQINEWPLKFMIKNYPNFNDIAVHFFTSTSQQRCFFVKSWPEYVGMDILIAVATPSQQVGITDITIDLMYDLTYSPTMEPTFDPTNNPTSTTIQPTLNPIFIPKYTENITIEIDLETKLNVTKDSNITQEIVKIITSQLEAKLDGIYLLSTPIISVEAEDGGYKITVIIEVGGDVQIDLDEDLINDKELEGKIEDDYDVTITDINIKYNGQQKHFSINIFFVLIVMGATVGLVFIVVILNSKCVDDKSNLNILDAIFAMISAANMVTDGFMAYYIINYYLFVIRDMFMLILMIGSGLFLVVPYIMSMIIALKKGWLNRGRIILTAICVILTGDSYITLKLIYSVSMPVAKWMLVILQYIGQIVIQCLFMILILKTFEIIILISIGLSLISCIVCLFQCKTNAISYNQYVVKIRFMVDMEDELNDIDKKHKEKRYVLQNKLSSLLAINKQYIKIGDMSVDARDVEIEIIHGIPHEISNDKQYVESMYINQMELISNLIKDIYGLISDIDTKLIMDKSNAFMTINSTSYRGEALTDNISTYSQIELVTNNGNKNDNVYPETHDVEDMYTKQRVNTEQETIGRMDTSGGPDENVETASSKGTGDPEDGKEFDDMYIQHDNNNNNNTTQGMVEENDGDLDEMYNGNDDQQIITQNGDNNEENNESAEDVEWIYDDDVDDGDGVDEMYENNQEQDTNQGYHETMGHIKPTSNGYGSDIDI